MKEVITQLKTIVKGLIQTYYNLTGHGNLPVFIIYASARTGSNVLVSLLKSHPNIHVYGEIYAKFRGSTTEGIWKRMVSSHKPKKIKLVGFKIFYNHPRHDGNMEIWEKLQGRKDIKVIHLTREDKLRTFLSRKIATQTDEWKNLNGKADIPLEKRRTSLSIQEFQEWSAWLDEKRELTKPYLKDHEWLEVTYESLAQNQTEEIRRIMDFLGMESSEVKSQYKKQNQEKLSELITNYEAFCAEAKGTEAEAFL